ncbi:MAG: glycoside hydrolase family 5 protein [Dehalococcoidia bacterium]
MANTLRTPLHTVGGRIVDASGRPVRLRGVNWYGAEGPDFVPGGLHLRTADAIARLTAELGANCVRLPFSNQLVAANPLPAAEVVAGDPTLAGRPALEVLDAIIDALTSAGLAVILDNHTSQADWCCDDQDGNGLWHTPEYPEAVWIDQWTQLAGRYRANQLVVGADLRNEPRGDARWGGRNAALDWPGAAERAGAAILTEAPDWLIVVEGVDYASDLRGAAKRPVQLPVAGRLVYSVHDYEWFHGRNLATSSMLKRWQSRWEVSRFAPLEVPLLLGEFGMDTSGWPGGLGRTTAHWLRQVIDLFDEIGASWIYWPLNGTMSSAAPRWGRSFGAREPFGLLNERWDAPANPALIRALFGEATD